EAGGDGLGVVAEQVEVGGHRPVLLGQRVDVEGAGEVRPALGGDLLLRLVVDGGLAEHRGDLLVLDEGDRRGDLPGGALGVGVDRPQVLLGEAGVAGQVGEGAFAGDQGAPVLGQGLQVGAELLADLGDLGGVVLGGARVVLGVAGVDLAERVADVGDVDLGLVGGHPGVRVGPALVFAGGDGDGLHAVGEGGGGGVQGVGELGEPGLQAQAVVEDEVGVLGADQVVGGGVVAVDLRAGAGDRLHLGVLAGDVAHHVGDDGEGGDDLGAPVVLGGGRGGAGGGARQHSGRGDRRAPADCSSPT